MNIPLCEPSIGKEEKELVSQVLDSGWLTDGPMNRKFEELFAEYIGTEHAISLNSCTSGLHLSIEASGITGEVIVPSFSWVASANAIVTAGAKPVFADINRDDRALNIEHVESLIGPDTEAIMIVHYGGQAGDIDVFTDLCEKKGLKLMEDSAETIGGEYKGRKAGSSGIGNYSFFPTKNITVGEGGMVTTNDTQLARKIRTLMAHGLDSSTYERESENKSWYKSASAAGYNFRMSNILAAIGVVQMDKIDDFNNLRRKHARYLTDQLSKISWVTPPVELENRKHIYQTYSIFLADEIDRTHFINYLRDKGIGASVHFDPPIHKHQYYKEKSGNVELPETEFVSSHIVSLPMYPDMEQNQLDYIINQIIDYNNLKE